MTPHPVDIPMARAQAHLANACFPQAIGAFRAAVGIDPSRTGAHVGLAGALAAQGRRYEAVEGLVEAAQGFAAREDHGGALELLVHGLGLDPSRVELHLELAQIEEALGRHEAALARVEGLAELYLEQGRTEEAAEVLRFASTWGEAVAAPVSQVPVHAALITGATVIARNPLLYAYDAEPRTVVARVPSAPLVLDDIDALEEVDEVDEVEMVEAIEMVEEVDEPDPDSVTRIAVTPVRQFARRAGPPQASRSSAIEDNALIERLRARAGLRPTAGVPRETHVRPTEPIAIRRSMLAQPMQEEDVTVRFRRPQPLHAAS